MVLWQFLQREVQSWSNSSSVTIDITLILLLSASAVAQAALLGCVHQQTGQDDVHSMDKCSGSIGAA